MNNIKCTENVKYICVRLIPEHGQQRCFCIAIPGLKNKECKNEKHYHSIDWTPIRYLDSNRIPINRIPGLQINSTNMEK